MSEIERVSRAIREACDGAKEYADEYCSPKMAEAAAIAAIAAMREQRDAEIERLKALVRSMGGDPR